MAGKLYLVPTPIGNLGDISRRAAEVLAAADFLAAEDTRVTVKLLNHLGLKKPMTAYHRHNCETAGPAILRRLEAGESCAFYIAGRLGMPASMLRRAARAAYEGRCVPGKNTAGEMDALKENILGSDDVLGEDLAGICLSEELEKEAAPRIIRAQEGTTKKRGGSEYGRGDSVMVLPDKKIGIVCREATEKGVLQVQLPGKKIWINHKRVKLLVAAEKLYPEDYDFSIIFDTVENRKLRHQMERKYVQGEMIESEDGPA